jgi:integrase
MPEIDLGKNPLYTPLLSTYIVYVKVNTLNDGTFQKVGECLYRYSNGVYYARIKVDGKEIKKSLRTTDRTLAKRLLTRFKQEQRQIDRSQGRITLSELCDRYLQTVQHQKPQTVAGKTRIIGKIKRDWVTGNLTQVTAIKPSDCDLFLARVGGGASFRNACIQVLREMFASALRDRIIAASPAQHLKYLKRETPIRKTPTFEQFQVIVESIRSQQFNGHDADESADFVEFIGLAGLGQAEASSLTWDDVDFERQQIITFRHKTKTGFVIPLYPQLLPLLERRYAQRTSDKVFSINNAKKAIAAACQRLNLPVYSHRSFRRMFITRAIEKGVDVKVIAKWQGHRDGGKLILDTYSHVNRGHEQRMAQLMIDEPEAQNIIELSQQA